ncbi:hypothetical protein KSS87_017266, partial [Heliosperma pusillum]
MKQLCPSLSRHDPRQSWLGHFRLKRSLIGGSLIPRISWGLLPTALLRILASWSRDSQPKETIINSRHGTMMPWRLLRTPS